MLKVNFIATDLKHTQLLTDYCTLGWRQGVPRLWAFFCLSQVLPVSFTQNLFYLALLRMPQTKRRVAAPRWPIISLLLAYYVCISVPSPSALWVLPHIFTARLLLCAPLFLCGRTSSRSSVVDGGGMQHILSSFAAQAVGLIAARSGLIFSLWNLNFGAVDLLVQVARQALFEHPAVSSLGCDLIISVLSFGAWSLTSKPTQSTDKGGDSKVESPV